MNEFSIADFIKYQRKQAGLTQEELAGKAGVGLRFIRELEQGKTTVRLDKVNQVLNLFGFAAGAIRGNVPDPYAILFRHFNRYITLTLSNGEKISGGIIGEVLNAENQIIAWEFIPASHLQEYEKTGDKSLIRIIRHETIVALQDPGT